MGGHKVGAPLYKSTHILFVLAVNSRHTPPQEEGAPPIPVRSGEGKLMMLKLMKGATKALKS